MHSLNMKSNKNWLRKLMCKFVVHSNEIPYRKRWSLGLDHVKVTCTEIEWNIYLDKVIWTTVCSTPFILEPGLNFWSLFIYWSELCRFKFAVFIQCEAFILWKVVTKKARSGKFWQKSYHDEVLVSFTTIPPFIQTDNHTS